MGLKAIREKASRTVHYPSQDAPDRIAFKLLEAPWSVQRKINNLLACEDEDGNKRTLAGEMMESALRGCVVGWETVGDVDIPKFSEEAIFELRGDILGFLFTTITDDIKRTHEEKKATPN